MNLFRKQSIYDEVTGEQIYSDVFRLAQRFFISFNSSFKVNEYVEYRSFPSRAESIILFITSYDIGLFYHIINHSLSLSGANDPFLDRVGLRPRLDLSSTSPLLVARKL
jgi:hypothetical protein